MRYVSLLQCPRCGGALTTQSVLLCTRCGHSFPIESGIPLLYWPEGGEAEPGSVTERIRVFYEKNPFPNYEDFDDLASLIDKARESVFARLLDAQLPFKTRVLDCGCGTGQLTNYLGIAERSVFGTDICLNSLRLADRFRHDHQLENVHFLQMNLFRPVFHPGTFDFIICNGVLHHTADPKKGLESLASLLKPGGFLVIGLYHRFGRLGTDLRRVLFRLFGRRAAPLDPRLRHAELGQHREEAWFADQYCNPHESKHTISEVLGWLTDLDLRFIKSIPKTRLGSRFEPNEKLFEPEAPGNWLERSLLEPGQVFGGAAENGFFVMIAEKPETSSGPPLKDGYAGPPEPMKPRSEP